MPLRRTTATSRRRHPPPGVPISGGRRNGTDAAATLLADLASLLRRTGGVEPLRRLLDALEAAGCGG
jgi:hypothetical protein